MTKGHAHYLLEIIRGKGFIFNDNTYKQIEGKRYSLFLSRVGGRCGRAFPSIVHCTRRDIIVLRSFCIFQAAAKPVVPRHLCKHPSVARGSEFGAEADRGFDHVHRIRQARHFKRTELEDVVFIQMVRMGIFRIIDRGGNQRIGAGRSTGASHIPIANIRHHLLTVLHHR